MKTNSIEKAWNMVNEIFPTDYMKDEQASANAGYPIYWSTADGVNAWISDLGSRLEVNLPDGRSINVWIEEQEQEPDPERVKTEKTIRADFETVKHTRHEETTVKMSAAVTLGIDTKLSDILDFIRDMNRMHAAGIKAIKAGDYFQFSIHEAGYRWTGEKLETVYFNSWDAVPVYEQDTNADGIYFNPDTRYTEAHRDMYIRKGHVFEDMTEYIG